MVERLRRVAGGYATKYDVYRGSRGPHCLQILGHLRLDMTSGRGSHLKECVWVTIQKIKLKSGGNGAEKHSFSGHDSFLK